MHLERTATSRVGAPGELPARLLQCDGGKLSDLRTLHAATPSVCDAAGRGRRDGRCQVPFAVCAPAARRCAADRDARSRRAGAADLYGNRVRAQPREGRHSGTGVPVDRRARAARIEDRHRVARVSAGGRPLSLGERAVAHRAHLRAVRGGRLRLHPRLFRGLRKGFRRATPASCGVRTLPDAVRAVAAGRNVRGLRQGAGAGSEVVPRSPLIRTSPPRGAGCLMMRPVSAWMVHL